MQRVRVFISHANEDKVIAGRIKKCLEKYFGFDVFVAHDDINPTVDWDLEITENLKKTDMMVVLVSREAEISSYVNQEIGMALSWGKKIFPVMLSDLIPFGFLSKIQGCPYQGDSDDDMFSLAGKIFFLIMTSRNFSKSRYKDSALDSVIYALKKSDCFRTSVRVMEIIRKAESSQSLKSYQVDAIKDATQSNNQVYDEQFTYPGFKRMIIQKYDVDINV